MIFEAPQSELFRFNIHSMSSKILKIPEFNLFMSERMIHKTSKCFPCVDIGKVLGVRTTTTEAIK